LETGTIIFSHRQIFFLLDQILALILADRDPCQNPQPKIHSCFLWVKSTSEACSIKTSLFQDLLG